MATSSSSETATSSSLGMDTPSSSGMTTSSSSETPTSSSSGKATPNSSGAATSSSESGSFQPNQGTTTSHAPAGQTYRGVEHAGECTLEVNAGRYPDTDNSYMLPPMFINEYPEPIDESTGEVRKHTRLLTKKEDNRFIGIRANASAEQAEYDVFSVFEGLVARKTKEALLVLRNFQLNPNDDQDFRTKVLTQEIGADFTGLDTKGECDVVIAVKNLGIVLVEIKTRFNEKQQTKAEHQLEREKLLFQRIMSHIAGAACQMPVVKLAIFAQEESSSPAATTSSDCHIIHKDRLTTQNFIQIWNELMIELNALKADNPFSNQDFRRFVRTISGVWCMQPYQKQHYQYNTSEASSTLLLQQNDDMVSQALFTSDAKKAKDKSQIPPPVANVELCRPSEGFPECKGLEVIYLTPEQKEFYQKFPRAILRGPAGSGKTILFYLKMVDILENHSNKNILIIAPPNHTLRFEQFLKSNGALPTISKTFPPPVSGGVVIMELEDFFDVSPDTLKSYDVTDHHLFIDDLQHLYFSSNCLIKCDDIVDFIERTHATSDAQLTLWCAVDVGQSVVVNADKNDNVSNLFFTSSSTARSLKIPVYVLHLVLRNSVEISTAVKKVRDIRIAKGKLSSVVLSNFDTGHRIRTQSVIYHKLGRAIHYKLRNKVTGSVKYNEREKRARSFFVERVREELDSLFDVRKPRMKLHEIAVLHDYDLQRTVVEAVRDMLLNTFNIIPQTIKQYITTNNNTIIMDSYKNVASFECACVVYLCVNSVDSACDHYNVMSRARTKLVVVDIDFLQRSLSLTDDDVMMTRWEEKNGTFEKLLSKPLW